MKKKSRKIAVPAPKPKPEVILPPDDPLRRHRQEEELDARAMAEKRLEAIKQIRSRPTSAKDSKN